MRRYASHKKNEQQHARKFNRLILTLLLLERDNHLVLLQGVDVGTLKSRGSDDSDNDFVISIVGVVLSLELFLHGASSKGKGNFLLILIQALDLVGGFVEIGQSVFRLLDFGSVHVCMGGLGIFDLLASELANAGD